MKRMKKLVTFVVYYIYAALSCVFLFTVGILRGRNRTFLYKIASHFGPFEADPDTCKPLLPTVTAREILPADMDVHILEPVAVDGNVTILELLIIIQLARQHGALHCFEVGTFDGRTTLNLAVNCAEQAKVYTLDLPQEELGKTSLAIEQGDIAYIAKPISGARFRGTPYEHKIVQLYGDSSTFDYSPYRNRMDLVFIDGSHSHDYVLNDSRRAVELLRERKGVILWHDYGGVCGGVTKCLNGLYGSEPGFRGLRHIEGTSLACLVCNGR